MENNKWMIKNNLFTLLFVLLCFLFHRMMPNVITKTFFNYYPSIFEYTKLLFTSSLLGILFQFAFFKKRQTIKNLLIQSEITTILFFLISLPFMSILKRKTFLFFILLITALILNIVFLNKWITLTQKKRKYDSYFIYGFLIVFYGISFITTIL